MDTLAKVSSDVVARTVAGETLLVPVRGAVAQCDKIYILNGSGSFLWEHLDGTKSESELADLMIESFEGATEDAARADVKSFLREMDTRGLLTWKERL